MSRQTNQALEDAFVDRLAGSLASLLPSHFGQGSATTQRASLPQHLSSDIMLVAILCDSKIENKIKGLVTSMSSTGDLSDRDKWRPT